MVTTLQDLRILVRKEHKMRTARQFSREENAEMAYSYADPRNAFSHSDYEKQKGITRSTFYTLMEWAVRKCMVSFETADQMKEKAIYNAQKKVGEIAGDRERNHYERLKEESKTFELPEEEAIAIIEQYAISGENRKRFCRRKYISTELFNRIMKKYIITYRVSDNLYEIIKQKSMKLYGDKAIAFWQAADEARNVNNGQG